MFKTDRPYQALIKQESYNAWDAGHRNIFWRMPCGSGKTHTFTSLIAEHGEPSVCVAHRDKLIAQTSCDLANKGVRHNIIGNRDAIRAVIALHVKQFGRSYYDRNSKNHVASVDTLVKHTPAAWMKSIRYLVQDEGHHCLAANKWGRVAKLFPQARGLYPTATPYRPDGAGLGRASDGVGDILLHGPSEKELIDQGFLADYRIFCPPNTIDLSNVNITATGDYSPQKLRSAVHKSQITGNVVRDYLRFASGKLGLTFAVDIEAAIEIAQAYNDAGVPAAVITSNTDIMVRYELMRQFEARALLQLVSVDILGEGTDIPAVEVISMARPSGSLVVVVQQMSRPLRPHPSKDRAIIIDHVGNVMRHGLPDSPRIYTLDPRERKGKSDKENAVNIRTCSNPACLSPYLSYRLRCPECGFKPTPSSRASIEEVDGDLIELDPQTLNTLRGEVARIDGACHPPKNLNAIAQLAVHKNHTHRQNVQKSLRDAIALQAGYWKHLGNEDQEIYRRFYQTYHIDILSAQALNAGDATQLLGKINKSLTDLKIVDKFDPDLNNSE